METKQNLYAAVLGWIALIALALGVLLKASTPHGMPETWNALMIIGGVLGVVWLVVKATEGRSQA